jgi:hypothetical protein
MKIRSILPLDLPAIAFTLHDGSASFDKLRMRGNLGGTKKSPHPEPVEGRTSPIPTLEIYPQGRSSTTAVPGSPGSSSPSVRQAPSQHSR